MLNVDTGIIDHQRRREVSWGKTFNLLWGAIFKYVHGFLGQVIHSLHINSPGGVPSSVRAYQGSLGIFFLLVYKDRQNYLVSFDLDSW